MGEKVNILEECIPIEGFVPEGRYELPLHSAEHNSVWVTITKEVKKETQKLDIQKLRMIKAMENFIIDN